MGLYTEARNLPAESTWTYGGTVRYILPTSGKLMGLVMRCNATPVTDARIALAKWRLMDYIDSIRVLSGGSNVIKDTTGRLAHVSQWLDGGPLITDQQHNYGSSTLRWNTAINFGRWPRDRGMGLDLSKLPQCELQIHNDATVSIFSAFGTPTVWGLFLKNAAPGGWNQYLRDEVYRTITTVANGKEYVKLQQEGLLRRIIMQVDPYTDTDQQDKTTLYNVLSNIRLTHKSKNDEYFNGSLRDLWHLDAFMRPRDCIVGAESYHSNDIGFRTGLSQTFYKAGVNVTHGAQNSYGPDIAPGDDAGTQRRQADSNSDQSSLLFAGVGPENCGVWAYDEWDDLSLCPDMAAEKDIELELTTANSSDAASGTIRVQTSRAMAY